MLQLLKQILTGIYCIFLKEQTKEQKVLEQTRKSCNKKFGLQLKDRKGSYQLRQILAVFGNLVSLILN